MSAPEGAGMDSVINERFERTEEMLTAKEVMPLLRYKSRPSFWAAVHAQGVPHVRVSCRRVLFPKVALDAWMQSRSTGMIT